jgi:hypothetical protein
VTYIARRARYWPTMLLLALVISCSGTSDDPGAAPSQSKKTIASSVTPRDCNQSPESATDGALRASTKNGEVWALPIGLWPAKVGHELKLVMRVTGTGDASFVAVGPDGSRLEPTEVQNHTTSNFQRPGDEWGSFFVFDRSGCWRILVRRGDLQGTITLGVTT